MDSESSSSSSPWSGLLSELLYRIADHLPSRLDVARFRAVCSSWRHAVPLRPAHRYSSIELPLLVDHGDHNSDGASYFVVRQRTLYCVEPITHRFDDATTNSWFIKLEETNQTRAMHLVDPFSRLIFDILPQNFPQVLNLLDYRVSEVGSVYGLEFIKGTNQFLSKPAFVKRVEICDDENELVIMVIYDEGKLSVWREGHKKWTAILDGHENSNFVDIIYNKGKFYAVDYTGIAVIVDPFREKIIEITPALPLDDSREGRTSKYLVEANGDLFLVEKTVVYRVNINNYEFPLHVALYKLDEDNHMWVSTKNVGDFAFFAGEDGSFSFSTREYHCCPKNVVYCAKDLFSCLPCFRSQFPGKLAGIYDLEKDKAVALSAQPHGGSKLFWPPPSWLN